MSDLKQSFKRRLTGRRAASFSLSRAHGTTVGGNVPIQKALAKPARPFDLLRPGGLSKRRGKSSTLFQLVARRDWQKVLIRASLCPLEITQKQHFLWYGTYWKLLPLHLACALDPPAIVIEKLLHGNVETAGMTMTKGRSKKPKLRFFRHRKKNELNGIEEDSLIATNSSVNELLPSPSGVTSSLLSDDYSGGMKHDDGDDDQEHAPCPRTVFHDNPLLNDADYLLPLHVACLYRASPGVIGHLCQAHPAGAKCFALGGMLPIHMLSAGFQIPPPITAPADFVTLRQDWRMADSLQHLVTAHPKSIAVKSHTNGMTPEEYIEATMEDGINKTICLRALGGEPAETLSDYEEETESSLVSAVMESDRLVPSEIMCDDTLSIEDDAYNMAEDVKWRAHNELYTLMVSHDWESAYDLLEDEPEQAHQWQYGIEIDRLDTEKPQLWKRLPVHNCCRFGAPIALLSIVLRHNPSCPPDPYNGTLPIHLACRYAPSLEIIQVLLCTDPACVKHQDYAGRLPLHFACIKNAPTIVLQTLLKAYPASVSVTDNAGKTPLDYCCPDSIDQSIAKYMKKLQRFLSGVENRKRQDLQKPKLNP